MTSSKIGPRPDISFELTPTKAEIEFFRENGFLALDRITTDEEVAWLRSIFELIFSDEYAGQPGSPVDRSGTTGPGQPVARLSQSFFPEMFFPEIMNTQFRRNAKRYAAALLSVPEKDISSWGHMIQKRPGGRAASPHQDHAYWQPELDYCALGVWLPMHDVSVEMGCMQFVPGSHKNGLMRHRQEDEPIHNVLTLAEKLDMSKMVACPAQDRRLHLPSLRDHPLHPAERDQPGTHGVPDGIPADTGAPQGARDHAVGRRTSRRRGRCQAAGLCRRWKDDPGLIGAIIRPTVSDRTNP
jgi:hypothetical protein